MKFRKLIEPFRVQNGRNFKLADHATKSPLAEAASKKQAKAYLAEAIAELTVLQDKLYAHNRWSVLLIFQAMDAAGKDSTIKHVMSGVNPQGCQVASFKSPSTEELDHDFLWRCVKRLPERGRIGIFNRSYYEEVLAVRVHPEFLDAQHLPEAVVRKTIWKERYQDIAAFERYLARQGTIILKFFLNVGLDEQKQRFIDRLERPEKNWKFSASDLKTRAEWPAYMSAYEDAIKATASTHAPWFVIPADQKWFMRALVVAALVDKLESLDLAYPTVDEADKAKFADYHQQLLAE